MPRLSPELRLLLRVPARVGVRSSELAPSSRFPLMSPTLSEMRVMTLRVAGAAESRISWRVLEGVPRFPAASATRAEKEWLRLVTRSESGVKSQLRPSTEALPRKNAPE